jgi:anti-anti-sigma regulatory factor
MLLVTSNKSKQLLYLCFVGTVRAEEFPGGREDVTTQLAGLSPGFRYLVDLTDLEFMGVECMAELGQLMELIGQADVGLLVRVIPDPSKDIGMNILTVFHYPHQLKVVTCQNLAEAVRALGL